jgi:hypothetical protein
VRRRRKLADLVREQLLQAGFNVALQALLDVLHRTEMFIGDLRRLLRLAIAVVDQSGWGVDRALLHVVVETEGAVDDLRPGEDPARPSPTICTL